MITSTRFSGFLLVLAFSVALNAGPAQVTVVNGASFDPTQPMAPGSLAAAFGQNLCGQTAKGDWIAPGQLPTTLGGCSLSVNGAPAMLLYVSPGQMNFVVPAAVASGTSAVVVNTGSQTLSGTMMTGPAGPGVFATNSMGMGQGAMLHATMWTSGAFSTTTNGQTTPVAVFLTGLDVSTPPTISIAGVPANVTWYGNVGGFVGLQQINIEMPAAAAGCGRVPVTVTSNGQTSNVTHMTVLPSGMGMMENRPRGHELSFVALNPTNNTALVTDANDDAVRIISLDSGATINTITLPRGSQAHDIAVSGDGTQAAVALAGANSVLLLNLQQNVVRGTIATGFYPSHVVYSGTKLLVTNGASGTVSVIDATTELVAQTVNVGFGPRGIDATATTAVVANLQGGTVSLIDLTSNYGVTTVPLPAGARPYDVAVSAAANKAVITAPMSNGVYVLDLGTKAVTFVNTSASNGLGPGAVAVNGSTAYVANQMSSSVTAVDLASGKVLRTFSVDPGPHALATNAAKNQLLVLSEGTGTLNVVDLGTYSITKRIDGGATERPQNWVMPVISSISPSSAAVGSTFTFTISGSNFQGAVNVEFEPMGMGMGRGMGGGMGMGNGDVDDEDPNIAISNVQINPAGTQITATVRILGAAQPGTRAIRIETEYGEVMGPMSASVFTVTR